MATNRIFKDGEHLAVAAATCTALNSPIQSGDPILWGAGNLPAVATSDEDSDGNVSVQFGPSGAGPVYEFPVVGENATVNLGIADGDAVFYDAGELNADDTNGTLIGYAFNNAVASGATTTIRVKLI